VNTLRVSAQPFGITVSSEKSKSWTDRHIVGRFEANAEFDKYTNLPDSVVSEYLATVGDNSDEATARRTALLAAFTPTQASSPISYQADDLTGWARLAGSMARAHALLGAGVLAIPDGDDTLDVIARAFALIGVDPSTVFAQADDDGDDAPEGEPEPTAVKSK
jgi:hypothetical protein